MKIFLGPYASEQEQHIHHPLEIYKLDSKKWP